MNTRWMQWAIRKYLPDILTGMAMAGVPLTAWLSAEAGMESGDEIRARYHMLDIQGRKDLTTKDKARLTWKNYIPPAVAGTVTVGCMFGAHKAHLHKEAMLATVVTLLSGKYGSLDRRAKELLGEERYQELQKLVGMDEMQRTKGGHSSEAEDETTYYEPYSEQYFTASAQAMLYAQLHINKIFHEYGGVTLNDYLNVLPGCRRADIGREIGWYQGTDEWEWNWGFSPDSPHFIDMTFEDISADGRNVKLICYNLAPSIPDEDWEPWK